MKSEIILRAIGQVSDDLVTDAAIEKIANWNMTPAGRRALRLGVAAALIICLLGTTVFATTWLFNLRIGDPVEVFTPTDGEGNSFYGKSYDISFLLPLNENAPALIDTYYFPEVPEMYGHSFGVAYAGMKYDRLGAIVYAWDIPGGEKQGIMFYQESSFDSNEITVSITGTLDAAPEVRETVLGGIPGVLILEPEKKPYAHQYFYWSNGDYVFYMRFPIDFTEEQMAQIVGSVKAVENVQQYLISMTEEEIEKTFG